MASPGMIVPSVPTLSYPTFALWSCVALYGCLLFFPDLGTRDLTSSHEARAAQNAQTILDDGQWLVPGLFDRQLELQKPPLFYWLVALIGWLRGGVVDAWAVRLPAACSALGCLFVLCELGRRVGRPGAGILAALILASCVHFTWLARVGRIDMPLTFSITLALAAFHLGNRDGAARWRWHALGYTSLAAGILLKGPIALVLPGVVCAAVWFLHARLDRALHWQQLRATSLWWGLPWTFALATPWFLWANYHTDNQLWEVFFWYHNFERGLGGAETLAAHPWWFYLPRAIVDLMPWSLAVPVALFWIYRDQTLRKNDDAWLGLVWFAAMALFLSCMRFKRADYLLPAYPGVAIFLASFLLPTPPGRGASGESTAPTHPRRWLGSAIVVLLAVYGIAWLTYHRLADDTSQPYRVIAQEIRGKTSRSVIFFRAESHVLALHVGKPMHTILEWENLEKWTQRPYPVYVVMPEDCAARWRDHLPANALEEVLRTREIAGTSQDRPLVVLRNRGVQGASR